MKPLLQSSLTLTLAALAAFPLKAEAEREDAFCEVREHGAPANDATGYCTVTLTERSISIRLANGTSFELDPGDRPGRFRDGDGNSVGHEVKSDGSHYYTWEGRDITVYFNRNEGLYY